MNHYLYKITNLETNEYYLGVRSCKCLPEEDKYMGSSSIWNKQFIKNNKKILYKEILNSSFNSRKDANESEVKLLKEHELDPLCINVLYDIIPSHLGKKQTEEWINKRKRSGEQNGMFGKHHTEETKKIISEKIKGKVVSEEVRQKISIAQKNRVRTEEEKKNMSNAAKEAYIKGTRKATKTTPCKITNINTGEIEYFDQIKYFSDKYNLNYSSVKSCMRQNGKYKNYKMEYVASNSDVTRKSDENGENLEQIIPSEV